jgi:hypothetical protein
MPFHLIFNPLYIKLYYIETVSYIIDGYVIILLFVIIFLNSAKYPKSIVCICFLLTLEKIVIQRLEVHILIDFKKEGEESNDIC